MSKKKSVIFVCMGNTCRSPMAEYLLKDAASKEGIELDVYSRGVEVSQHSSINPSTLDALNDHDFDITKHQPKALELEDILQADLVLALDTEVLERITELLNEKGNHAQLPVLMKKTSTLKDYLGMSSHDIADPWDKITRPMYRVYTGVKGTKLYEATLGKIIPEENRIYDFIRKRPLLPNVGPYRLYRNKVYGSTRDEIASCIESLTAKLKEENDPGANHE